MPCRDRGRRQAASRRRLLRRNVPRRPTKPADVGQALDDANAGRRTVAGEARSGPSRIAILLYDGVDLLDSGGPYEVFLTAARLAVRDGAQPPFEVVTITPGGDPVAAYGGLLLTPHADAAAIGEIDVLIVPGTTDIARALEREYGEKTTLPVPARTWPKKSNANDALPSSRAAWLAPVTSGFSFLARFDRATPAGSLPPLALEHPSAATAPDTIEMARATLLVRSRMRPSGASRVPERILRWPLARTAMPP